MSKREYQIYLINYVLGKEDPVTKNKNYSIIDNYSEDYFRAIEFLYSLNKTAIPIHKEILFYPTLSLEYFGKTKYESIEKNKNFNPGLLEALESYFLEVSNKKELEEEMMNPLKWTAKKVPGTLIMVGNVDLLKDEAKEYYEKMNQETSKYVELPFCAHGFLKTDDKELENEIYSEVKSFLG